VNFKGFFFVERNDQFMLLQCLLRLSFHGGDGDEAAIKTCSMVFLKTVGFLHNFHQNLFFYNIQDVFQFYDDLKIIFFRKLNNLFVLFI
jgi:hypothetical protein